MPGGGRPKMPQLDCTCKILRCSRCHYCPTHSCKCNTDDQEDNLVVLRTPSSTTNNTTITNMISVSTSCTTRSTTTTESRRSSRKRKCKNSDPFPSEFFDSPVKKKNLADQFSSEKDDTVQNYTEKSSKVSTPEIALSHLQRDSFDDIPTRDIKRLCTRVALDHCHDEYYSTVVSSDLPRYDLHSLKPTPGQHFRTYGDIVTFHNSTDGSEDKDALDKHKKRVSNADARLSVDFPNEHPGEYNFMIKETKKYLQQLCEAQLPNAKDKLFQDVVNQCYEKINAEWLDEEKVQIVTNLKELYCKVRKGSVEKKTLAAAIHGAFPNNLLSDIFFRQTAEEKESKERHLELLKAGKNIPTVTHSRKRKSQDVVEEFVDFTYNACNTQFHSFGHKIIKLDQNESVTLARVTRLKEISIICSDYMSNVKDRPKSEKLGRRSCENILKTITGSGSKVVACVDYVFTNLVTDPIDRLQSVIDYVFRKTSNEYVEHSSNLLQVRHFLKYEFPHHIRKDDGDGFHSISHALTKRNKVTKYIRRDIASECICRLHSSCSVCKDTSEDSGIVIDCNGCKFPFWFCDKLIHIIEKKIELLNTTPNQESQDIAQGGPNNTIAISLNYNHDLNLSKLKEAAILIDDIKKKFFYHMQHQIRVHCQRDEYNRVEEEMKEEATRTKRYSLRILIIIDFKQKFEPISARESQVEGFGKRGIGWHGASAIYYEWDETSQTAVRKIFYADQILDKNSTQDTVCVVSLVESFIQAIKENFGNDFIKRVIICSDKAGCYSSNLLLIFIPLLNIMHIGDIFIERLIHTETQDGKGICDSHFAIAMKHIKHFIHNFIQNRKVNIKSPRGLAKALAWNGGIRNSIVQLVETDRKFLEVMANVLSVLAKKLETYFNKILDVSFEPPPAEVTSSISKKILLIDPSKAKESDVLEALEGYVTKVVCRAHSGYGEKIEFTIDYHNQSVKLGDAGLSERRRYLCLPCDEDNTVKKTTNILELDHTDENTTIEEICSAQNINHTSKYLNVNGDNDYNSDDDEDFVFIDSDESNCDSENESSDGSVLELQHENDDDLQYQSLNMGEGLLEHSESNGKPFPVTNVKLLKKTMLIKSVPTSRTRKRKSNRESNDEGIKQPRREDILARAVRYAQVAQTRNTGYTQKVTIHDDDLLNKSFYFKADSYKLPEKFIPYGGFARRKNDNGDDLFGARYIDRFKEYITEKIELGNKVKGDKVNPAQILEDIMSDPQNKDKFLFPYEYEISSFVSSYLQNAKNTGSGGTKKKRGRPKKAISSNDLETNISVSNQTAALDVVLSESTENTIRDWIHYNGKYEHTPVKILGELMNDEEIKGELSVCKSTFFEKLNKQNTAKNDDHKLWEKKMRSKISSLKTSLKLKADKYGIL